MLNGRTGLRELGSWHHSDVDDAERDELARLRRRVYGPAATGGDDPAAVARLAVLEAGGEHAVVAAGVPVASLPDRQEVSGGTGTLVDVAGRRRIVVRWVASVLLAVIAAVSTVLWLDREPGTPVGVVELGRSASKSVSVSVSGPALLSEPATEGAVVVSGSFHGLTLSKLPRSDDELQMDDECLLIVPDSVMQDAVGSYGCGAGEVPATVPMNVTPDAPPKLRNVFPVGTTLVFILDGDSVRVRSIGR
jgi:hypothetical protein